MYLSSVRSLFRPVRIYLNLFTISLQKMWTSKSHLGIPGFVSSPRQSLNKSESSNYTANGDLEIKSVFVNIVSSAIFNSQAGYRCTLVPRLPFPVPRSPFPVPRSPFPVPRSPLPVLVTSIDGRARGTDFQVGGLTRTRKREPTRGVRGHAPP